MKRTRRNGGRKARDNPLVNVLSKEMDAISAGKNDGRKTGEECKLTDHGETADLITKSTRISTPEQALAKARIDTSLWEVDRETVNSWEVAAFDRDAKEWRLQDLWQVKLHLRRRVPKRYANSLDWLESRLKKLRLRPLKPAKPCGNILYEPSLYDAQLGRYAWGAETGQDVDIERATAVYENAVADMCERVRGFNIAESMLAMGHDIFEVDNWSGTTEKGTPQDVDTRFPRVFGVSYIAVERCVLRLRKLGPVRLKYIPGNHDPATAFYLCFALKERFRDFEDVEVDISPKSRKYVQWGVNLIGMTHGNEEKRRDLPTIMAAEVPEMWAATKYREWHTGHDHTARQTVHNTTDEFGGIRVRVLPSIAGTNRWSYKKGYNNARQAAEAYLWDKTEGYVGHFSVNARVE